MNKRIRELAEQAGFVMWSECDWKPRGEVIDWANNYDAQIKKFAQLVRVDEREACAKLVEPLDESLADEIRARGNA